MSDKTTGMFAILTDGEPFHHPGFAKYDQPPTCLICGQETHTPVTLRECVAAVRRGDRYPQWKVDLFRAGTSEHRQSASGQMSGRAFRTPGA